METSLVSDCCSLLLTGILAPSVKFKPRLKLTLIDIVDSWNLGMSYNSDCKQLVYVSVQCLHSLMFLVEFPGGNTWTLLFLIYVNAMSGVRDDKTSFVC